MNAGACTGLTLNPEPRRAANGSSKPGGRQGAAGDYPLWRCLAASNRNTAAAADTLSEVIRP
jgi:hypothetical protein